MKKYSPFHALLRAADIRLSGERPYGDYKKVPHTAERARLFNMYAIIKTGGKQYRVCVGDKLKVESLEAEVGSQITLTEVLAVAGEDGLKVGAPVLEGAFQVPSPQALHEERRPPSELHRAQDRSDRGLIRYFS